MGHKKTVMKCWGVKGRTKLEQVRNKEGLGWVCAD